MAISTYVQSGDSPVDARPPGARRSVSVTLIGDAVYPTGGSTLTPSAFGLVKIDHVIAGLNTAGTHLYVWDGVNSKLLGFSALSTQIVNGVDVSAHRIPVTISGY